MKQKIGQKGIGERVGKLIDYYQYSVSMFAKKVGIDPGNFSKKIKGTQPWTIFDINKICGSTDASRNWLMNGTDDMLKNINEINLNTLITTKDSRVGSTRPRLPIAAAAGHLTEYIEGVMLYQCEQMPVIRRFPDYDFTMFIRGNSMEPKYESGDEIALKKATCIEWGKDYVLDTDDGAIFKKIYEDGDSIRCVSYNHDEYPDFLVPKEIIHAYYKFVGMIRV